MHVSLKLGLNDIHIKYPNYIPIVTLLYPTLFIRPVSVLHDEIILTVTSSLSMWRSAASFPSRMLEPLRDVLAIGGQKNRTILRSTKQTKVICETPNLNLNETYERLCDSQVPWN
jgi:hypothetical protein